MKNAGTRTVLRWNGAALPRGAARRKRLSSIHEVVQAIIAELTEDGIAQPWVETYLAFRSMPTVHEALQWFEPAYSRWIIG